MDWLQSGTDVEEPTSEPEPGKSAEMKTATSKKVGAGLRHSRLSHHLGHLHLSARDQVPLLLMQLGGSR